MALSLLIALIIGLTLWGCNPPEPTPHTLNCKCYMERTGEMYNTPRWVKIGKHTHYSPIRHHRYCRVRCEYCVEHGCCKRNKK